MTGPAHHTTFWQASPLDGSLKRDGCRRRSRSSRYELALPLAAIEDIELPPRGLLGVHRLACLLRGR
jgi:hypothetical protein